MNFFSQVKRKRESSEMSDDLYMDDFNNLNSRSTSLREHQQQQSQQQQHQYAAMVMPNSLDTSSMEHIQQHLCSNKQSLEYKPAISQLQVNRTKILNFLKIFFMFYIY